MKYIGDQQQHKYKVLEIKEKKIHNKLDYIKCKLLCTHLTPSLPSMSKNVNKSLDAEPTHCSSINQWDL